MASSSVLADAMQPSQLPLQPQVGHAVLDAQQLDVAAVRVQVGPHAVQRLLHPVLQRHRVQAVDQHQAAHDAVGGQVLPGGLVEHREDALQALAVEVHDGRRQLLGEAADLGVRDLLQPRRQLLDALDERVLGGRGHLSTSPWACAPPCAPCPCRTCARRRAGTGRSCAPPA